MEKPMGASPEKKEKVEEIKKKCLIAIAELMSNELDEVGRAFLIELSKGNNPDWDELEEKSNEKFKDRNPNTNKAWVDPKTAFDLENAKNIAQLAVSNHKKALVEAIWHFADVDLDQRGIEFSLDENDDNNGYWKAHKEERERAKKIVKDTMEGDGKFPEYIEGVDYEQLMKYMKA